MSKQDNRNISPISDKKTSNRYRVVAIFSLEMAYSNACLVTKPYSDWLIVGK